jgi:hypothetical protein
MDAVMNAADLCGAVEVSEDRQRASVALAGVVGDLVRVDLVEYGVSPVEAVRRVEELNSRYQVDAWAVDPSSPAGSLLLQLAALGVRVVQPTAREVAAACGTFLDMVRDATVKAGRSGPLRDSVRAATARRLAGAMAWDRKAFDAGPVLAASLACWASANHSALGPDDVGVIFAGDTTPAAPRGQTWQVANWPGVRQPPPVPPGLP